MPRRKNTKPTSIYWLVDVRPEVLAQGYAIGKPFYCGKTVDTPHARFQDHMCRAVRYPGRKISKLLTACGRKNIRIVIMATVPPEGDWVAAEQRWIAQIRLTNPDSANIGHGGEGPTGMVHTPESRAKMSAVQSNRSDEWLRRISEGRKGIGHSPDTRARMSDSQRTSAATARHIAHLAEINRGREKSPETRTKLSASLKASFAANPRPKGQKNSPETIAKRIASCSGQKRTPEALQNMRDAQRRRREQEAATAATSSLAAGAVL